MPKKNSKLDGLDLDTTQQTRLRKHPIFLLIKSLKDNYNTYAKMISEREIKRGAPEKTFYAIPKIDIPEMKSASPYKSWNQFVRKMQNFLDGKNPGYIDELTRLESKLKNDLARLKEQKPEVALESLLEQTLKNFEEEAGFSSLKIIPKDSGVLTAEVFFEMIRDGHPFTDLGASEQHGKLSHRLQFYLLGQYLKTHLSEFFKVEDLKKIVQDINNNKLPRPDKWKKDKVITVEELTNNPLILVSIYYRLLGTNDFNQCFDWNKFIEKRKALNTELNPGKASLNVDKDKELLPERFNAPTPWDKSLDNLGYVPYGSIPSSFGFLQYLGCFPNLPQLGKPNVEGEKKDPHLKRVLDTTPRVDPMEPFKSKSEQKNYTLHSKVGLLFKPEQKNSAQQRENVELKKEDTKKGSDIK